MAFEGLGNLPVSLQKIANATDIAGGAVIVFNDMDHIVAANAEQRRIMPCCSYGHDDTYRSLFWSALHSGMTGNPAARRSPAEWLEDAVAARRCSPNLDFVNSYSWGEMLVSHMRIENGFSIQLRLNMRSTGVSQFFKEDGQMCFGVLRAICLQNEINILRNALDSIGIAVAMTDGCGRLLHSNASFSDFVGIGDGLVDDGSNGLRATDPCDNLVLQQGLENVASGALPVAYVPIRRRKGDPLIVSVSAGNSVGTTVLAVPRFGEDLAEINSALKQALGMSASEADAMSGLVKGETTEELMSRRMITKGTAYRLVDDAKKRLEKSGFSAPDKSRIVSLVTGLAAIIRAPSVRKH